MNRFFFLVGSTIKSKPIEKFGNVTSDRLGDMIILQILELTDQTEWCAKLKFDLFFVSMIKNS